jgi:hypothetical protein
MYLGGTSEWKQNATDPWEGFYASMPVGKCTMPVLKGESTTLLVVDLVWVPKLSILYKKIKTPTWVTAMGYVLGSLTGAASYGFHGYGSK